MHHLITSSPHHFRCRQAAHGLVEIKAILILLSILLPAGCLLYLPFFLWFRYRRRSVPSGAAEVTLTRAGYLVVFVETVVLFIGFAAGVLAPESALGSWTTGSAGLLRWMVCAIVATCILNMVLERFGVVVVRQKTDGAAPSGNELGRLLEQRGRFKVATVHGVPVFIHWSFPLGGLLVSFFTSAGVLGSVFYCLAFLTLVAIHEAGHFGAARLLNLRVFAIDISGWGGTCLIQVPRSAKHTALVYSAGLIAQGLLLLLTLGVVAVFGAPESLLGRSLVITFTFVNLVLLVINIIPSKAHGGLSNDGEVLWELFLHVFKGRPHPLAKYLAVSPVFSRETSLLMRISAQRDRPFRHRDRRIRERDRAFR